MTQAKQYQLRTLNDIYDQVPADRIVDCCMELGAAMAASKMIRTMLAEEVDVDALLQMEDVHIWIDDGEKKITVVVEAAGDQTI